MIDPRLLKHTYPCKGIAYVETGKYIPRLFSTGRKAEGHWINGVALSVEQCGEFAFWVVFRSATGEIYHLEHSEQFQSRT